MKLANKRDLIAGGSTGIGAATAKLFSEEGASVVVADINDQNGNELVQGINENGGTAHYVHCDLSNSEDVKALLSEVDEKINGLDILVNTVGLMHMGDLLEMTEEQWDSMFAVNAKSCFLLAKYSVPMIQAAGGGSIVFMSSGAALRGNAGVTGYCGTKGAVSAFSRALAVELAPSIRVNALSPGWTDTPFNAPVIEAMGGREAQEEMIANSVPLERQAIPEEMAKPILFLVSDDSSYMTSGVLIVDGGNH